MAKNIKFNHTLVLVHWLDAESIDGWTPASEVDHEIAPVLSSGWLIREEMESITLALNHDIKNESYSCIMKIPRGMIVKIKKLRS